MDPEQTALRDVGEVTPDGPTQNVGMPVLRGSHPYQLRRELGKGGQGAVFEAEDLESGRVVAVKILRSLGADALTRFKREFRVRERVAHPSLVEFGELAQDGSTWFFTMSLIEGVPLLEYLRQASSEQELRRCFAQLASAIAALHDRELIHRDVKSDNVLVERAGRVVLLDLGLTVITHPHGQPSTQVMGTPRYMAPEQWSGIAASRATDWYAFGVLLFEGMAKRAPFEGNALELFLAKTQHDPPSLRELAEAPAHDLAELCDGLLRRDPAQRFGLAQVQACLSQEPERTRALEVSSELVGRTHELAQLDAALQEASRGSCVLMVVEGPSGIGKSALLQAFLSDVRARGACWAFSGRCYETERVPFNAFDELLEALARQLRQKPSDNYRPRHAELLARVFPVLSFVHQRTGDSSPPLDPAEVRARAMRALRELLGRMADERPVILCVDDVQWADADSFDLIALLSEADFPLLLVLGAREGERQRFPDRVLVQRIVPLAKLDLETTRVLAQTIAPQLDVTQNRLLEELHLATAGSPFLISEYARHVAAHGAVPTQGLRELVRGRIAQLPSARRKLVELVAVSCGPIERKLAVRLCGADDIADVSSLARERLLRTLERDGTGYLDVYHDRLREAVCELLASAELKSLRSQLASALEQNGAQVERLIAYQLVLNEDADKAFSLAVESARAAEQGLAFRRAAELYETALSLSPPTPERTVELHVDAARAWRNAHCPKLAAEALSSAALSCADERQARELRRQAGDQLLLSGELDRGLTILEGTLADNGLSLPLSAGIAVGEGLVALQALLKRGLVPAEQPNPDASEQERVALCLFMARCLLHIDLRGLPFAIRGLQLALDLGQPVLLQEALVTFVMVTAGHLPNMLVEPAFEQCKVLTEARANDGYAQAIYFMALAEIEHFRGDYTSAQLACEHAEQALLERCVGVSRELGQVRSLMLVMAYSDRGDFRTHAQRALTWLEDAEHRGDLFRRAWLGCAQSLAWMAQDNPVRARAEMARAEQTWPAGLGGTFETACALFLDAIDRYEDVRDVHERPAQGRASVLHSPVAQTALLQGYLHLQVAWGCLRNLGSPARAQTRKEADPLYLRAQEAVQKMRGLGVRNWLSVADALAGNLALLSGQRKEAEMLFERAQTGFVASHMAALGACAKRRRGEIVGGELGGRWIQEADSDLSHLGVSAPARFARAYFSPFAL
jgi:hypothetical protein